MNFAGNRNQSWYCLHALHAHTTIQSLNLHFKLCIFLLLKIKMLSKYKYSFNNHMFSCLLFCNVWEILMLKVHCFSLILTSVQHHTVTRVISSLGARSVKYLTEACVYMHRVMYFKNTTIQLFHLWYAICAWTVERAAGKRMHCLSVQITEKKNRTNMW